MTERVFITNNNMATFTCRRCEKTKTIDVSQYKHLNKAIRVKLKCPCGYSYTAILERRGSYRKKTNITGLYFKIVSGKKEMRGNIIIKNISRYGLKLKFKEKPNLEIEDKLLVEFKLDNNMKSLIRKEVIIRNIDDKCIGVEFCSVNSSNEYDKAIGFYLLR